MYENVETSTQNVITALKIKEDIAAQIQNAKDDGLSAASVANAEKQAEVINELVDKYEATFVSTGRTLAEVINLPATLLFKMTWINGIMEVSEGPPTQSMIEVFESVKVETEAANANFNNEVANEVAKLEALLK